MKDVGDAAALGERAPVHGERQYICQYDNCGKRLLDSSELKRHFLIHTGKTNFVCPHEGCGKAFSLAFNLKAHMKTHSADNYHVCQYPECGRRFTQESKLRAHARSQHEENLGALTMNHDPPYHHQPKPVKISATPPAPSAELNLKEHPNHDPDAGVQVAASSSNDTMCKRSKPDITTKIPPPKVPKHQGGYGTPSPADNVPEEHQWPSKVLYEDDSEETEEEDDSEDTEEEDDSE